MSDTFDEGLSRRRALLRLSALALAAYAAPSFTTLSVAHADGSSGGSGGGEGGGEGGDSSGASSSDNSSPSEASTPSDSEDDSTDDADCAEGDETCASEG